MPPSISSSVSPFTSPPPTDDGASPVPFTLTGTMEGRAAIVQLRPVIAVVTQPDPRWASTTLSCDEADPCGADQLVRAPTLTLISRDGATKYVLGEAFATGGDFTSLLVVPASSFDLGMGWGLAFSLGEAGRAALLRVTTTAVEAQPPRNEMAMIVDGVVASAPITQSPITGGHGVLTSGYTEAEAMSLADRIAQAGS